MPSSLCTSLRIERSAISLREISRSTLPTRLASSTTTRSPLSGRLPSSLKVFPDGLVSGCGSLLVDSLPLEHKLNGFLSLCPNIPIGSDTHLDYPLDLIWLFSDFLYSGTE